MSSQNVLIRRLRGLLQLLAISYYLTEFGVLIVVYPFLLLFLYFVCWPLALAYTIWYLYDHYYQQTHERGGRQCAFFKRFWHWRWASSYFPVKLIKTEDLPPDRNYLFCLQPHGLFSLGTIFSLVTNGAGFQEKFKGLKQHILTVPAQVVTPFHREISMALGYVSASKKSLLHILDRKRKGNVAMLMLGGSVETIYAQQNTMNVCIANRKGFVKVAYQTGAPLVPVIVFGENNMYQVTKYPEDHLLTKLQKRLASCFNVTFVVFKGRGLFTKYFGFLPFRTPINTVVGRPIEFEQCDNPSQEQIDTLHARYLDALTRLYEEYNPLYGDKQVRLNIM